MSSFPSALLRTRNAVGLPLYAPNQSLWSFSGSHSPSAGVSADASWFTVLSGLPHCTVRLAGLLYTVPAAPVTARR